MSVNKIGTESDTSLNKRLRLGYCLCGSFCTFSHNIEMMRQLSDMYDIVPIMSFNAATLDTRFGAAKEHIATIEGICGRQVIRTIEQAEPIGPTHMTDIMLVSPCTGNTLAKLASGIIDTPVTMSVKSHLRNNLPVVVAVSTNDALTGSAKNIGLLQNAKNYYFVPMGQDNHIQKPSSIVSKFEMIPKSLEYALEGKQLQPMMLMAY